MPLHLPAPNRRQFFRTTAAGVVVCAAGSAMEADTVDGDLVYLLNDTHVGEKQTPDSPVPSHLRQVVEELIQRMPRPKCVMINGDLALKDGQLSDYRHLARLLQPLREARLDTHLTLGNHDNRDAFFAVMQEARNAAPAVQSRHTSVVETAKANFFLLDSLQETMVTPGTIGAEQSAWLARALDAHAAKPAIVVAHHNPRVGGDPLHFPGGLVDSLALWEVFASRPQVKAYIHGHIHDRSFAEHQGIHIINTPATSYVADPKKSTTGWTTARLTESGVTLTTYTTDPEHPWNGESKTLVWRKG